MIVLFFFFNDTATTEIYTLSLHDALPIYSACGVRKVALRPVAPCHLALSGRSEEHTSELQSHLNLVCRLLLEKKKNSTYDKIPTHHGDKYKRFLLAISNFLPDLLACTI